VPDIVDFVFGVPNSKISSRGPKIILYKELKDDSTIGSFETILIRIYRENEGGKPKFKPIEKLDDFNKREIEKWLDTERKLISVDLDKALKEECKNKNLDNAKKAIMSWFTGENLGETLRKTKSGNIGFLIFKTRDKDLYEHCVRVLQELYQEYRDLDILYVKPQKLDDETKRELISLIWGNLKFKKEELSGIVHFDDLFNYFKREFEERLESISRQEPYISITKRHRGLNESDDIHYPVKVFVVKYIANTLGLKRIKDINIMKRLIHTEETFNRDRFSGDRVTYPDIYVDTSAQYFGNEVFEIETLFGEGMYSLKKIDETIEKYEQISNPPLRVNIVLENMTFLIHFKDIIEKKKIHQKLNRNFDIEFWTLDIQNNKLLPLQEVIKEIKSLYLALSRNSEMPQFPS